MVTLLRWQRTYFCIKKKMKRLLIFFMLSVALITSPVYAQQGSINGRLVTNSGNGVDGAAVILHTADSVYLSAQVTDSTGYFIFPDLSAGNYLLFFQHVAFLNKEKEVTVAGSGVQLDSVWMDSKNVSLQEVEVTASRPMVKVENGRLTYDIPQLTEGKTVTNAFEVLKEVPGIMSSNDKLSLVGAPSMQLILNGQLTTMSYEQLLILLKSLPASRVLRAEVMYSAPPQYNVRGALLNIIIGDEVVKGNLLQGEVAADYNQKRNAGANVRANILYNTPKLSADFLYRSALNQTQIGENMFDLHTFENKTHEIDQRNYGKKRSTDHLFRAGLNYTFHNKDKLSTSYTIDFSDGQTNRYSDIRLQSHTRNKIDNTSQLHNLKVEYNSHTSFVAGADYTFYKDPTQQFFVNAPENLTEETFKTDSKQQVNKVMLFANKTHTLPKEWTLNYGTNLSYSALDNLFNYFMPVDGTYILDPASSSFGTQKEYVANAFTSVTKSFTEKFSAQASLSLEYYRATNRSRQHTEVLWNACSLFPNAELTYLFNPQHILQFSLSSDKTYPPYWAINPLTWNINAYSEVQGNQYLQPSRVYSTQLNYIWKQKYVISGYFQQSPDYFIQLPYQSPEKLKKIFQTVNLDYQQCYGMALIIPFSVKKILDSKVVLNGFYQREKDSDFFAISYDRKVFTFDIQSSNTINISSKPDLKLDLSGYYTHNRIQGIFDLGNTFDVSAGLKWTFAKEKAILILRGTDLFDSHAPDLNIDYAGQYSRMGLLSDSRTITLSFIYKFGGYKTENKNEIDKSRMSRDL